MSNHKILIAEDDAEARELLALVLGSGGYEVLAAEDGLEALELARTHRPGLLITDIVMPRMDGYELARQLREDATLARTPVILCSASYQQREVQAMARALGVFTMLAKPFERHTVHALVKRALQSASAAPAAQRLQNSRVLDDSQLTHQRLHALVEFSRRLLTTLEPAAIPAAACHAAREILLAQYAELVVCEQAQSDVPAQPSRCCESGLGEAALGKLLSSALYEQALERLADGRETLYPPSEPAPVALAQLLETDEAVSILGVPVASGSRLYGHLLLLNRIGLSGFTEEDRAIAHAIAAQIAVAWENAARLNALSAQIAQRAAAENEVRRLNQALEQRVAERTAELQIANRELEAFSYSVAHDLRSPLRLIDAHVQMLREEQELRTPGAIGRLDHVSRGVAQMSALIDGLLALARINHVELRSELVALDTLVEQARCHLQQELYMRAIEWRISPLPRAHCDPALIRQVFINLLANAIKYTRLRRGARIEIGAGQLGAEPFVFVRDNGVGFDMRYANKLFGVFQRLHPPGEFEGTGIGLATVHRIIERHGGRIWADAELGAGAVFRFTFPGMEKAPAG